MTTVSRVSAEWICVRFAVCELNISGEQAQNDNMRTKKAHLRHCTRRRSLKQKCKWIATFQFSHTYTRCLLPLSAACHNHRLVNSNFVRLLRIVREVSYEHSIHTQNTAPGPCGLFIFIIQLSANNNEPFHAGIHDCIGYKTQIHTHTLVCKEPKERERPSTTS